LSAWFEEHVIDPSPEGGVLSNVVLSDRLVIPPDCHTVDVVADRCARPWRDHL